MKVFSLKKYMEDMGHKKATDWAKECDGKTVRECNALGYSVNDDWCEEVPENKKEFNVGDRVIAKRSDLDGKTGTIIGFDGRVAAVQFDENVGGHNCGGVIKGVKGKHGHCWWVGIRDLEPINPDKLIFKGNKTILIKDGKKYVSKCEDGDVYDKEKGLLLCLAKANGVSYEDLRKMIDGASYELTEKQLEAVKGVAERIKVFVEAGFKALKNLDNANVKPEAEKTVKEVERVAKVGEYIKIVAPEFTFGDYDKGDVFKVEKVGTLGVNVDNHGEDAEGNKKCNFIQHSEYVVLENYKPYKITLSEFWESEDELAIHCKTEDEAKELLKAFDKAGKTWESGEKYTEDTKWKEYKDQTHYYNDGLFSSNMYIEDHDNITVYEFNEVDLNN